MTIVSPSRNTFNPAKGYDQVQFVGGTGRHVFDAEMNEAQQIAQYTQQLMLSSLIGNADYDNNTGTMIDTGGDVTVSGTNYTVNVTAGYIAAAGKIIRLGTPNTVIPVAVFNNSDSIGLQAIIYYDVYETQIDASIDSNLLDPSYGSPCAQRIKLNASLTVTKGVNVLPSVPTGHTYVLLAVITNNHAILLPTDIVRGPVAPSVSAQQAAFVAFQATVNSEVTALSAALTTHEGPVAYPRHINWSGEPNAYWDANNNLADLLVTTYTTLSSDPFQVKINISTSQLTAAGMPASIRKALILVTATPVGSWTDYDGRLQILSGHYAIGGGSNALLPVATVPLLNSTSDTTDNFIAGCQAWIDDVQNTGSPVCTVTVRRTNVGYNSLVNVYYLGGTE